MFTSPYILAISPTQRNELARLQLIAEAAETVAMTNLDDPVVLDRCKVTAHHLNQYAATVLKEAFLV